MRLLSTMQLRVHAKVLRCPESFTATRVIANEWLGRTREMRADVSLEMGLAKVGFATGSTDIWTL